MTRYYHYFITICSSLSLGVKLTEAGDDIPGWVSSATRAPGLLAAGGREMLAELAGDAVQAGLKVVDAYVQMVETGLNKEVKLP